MKQRKIVKEPGLNAQLNARQYSSTKVMPEPEGQLPPVIDEELPPPAQIPLGLSPKPKTSAVPPACYKYLDGLRGIACLCVMLVHKKCQLGQMGLLYSPSYGH